MNKSVLHWSYRDFREIPMDLFNYGDQLQEVYLKENFIQSIPEWLFVMTNLTFIHLSGNLIEKVPEGIRILENLEFLDISANRIRSLPESIGQLRSLKKLNASGNEITALPKTIGQLKRLESLDISANLLCRIPNEIGNCCELTEIVSNDNLNLKRLPNSIAKLSKLDTICADRCGLLVLPAVLCEFLTFVRVFFNRFVNHIPIVYLKHTRAYYDIVQPAYDSVLCVPGYVSIIEKSKNKKLLLPLYTRAVYPCKEHRVFSLFDICLRRIKSMSQSDVYFRELPSGIIDFLENTPVATCATEHCHKSLFTEYHLGIIKRMNSSSNLIFSCYYCSRECANLWLTQNNSEYYEVPWYLES